MFSKTHRYHPDEDAGDPPDAILYDGCPRCTEHAAHPAYSLDRDNLSALTAKVIAVETKADPDHYATLTEGDAASVIWEYLTFARKLSGLSFEAIQEVLLSS